MGRTVGLFILGTGVLAEECCALAEDMKTPVEAFVENLDREKPGTSLCARPIIWVDELPERAQCICALSTTKRRTYIEQVRDRVTFATLTLPSSSILPRTALGEGTVVSTGVLIGSNTMIGRWVFLNRGARIGHHTQIGDFVTVQPGANVAGATEIGEQTLHRDGRDRARTAQAQDRQRRHDCRWRPGEARCARPHPGGRCARGDQEAKHRPALSSHANLRECP